MAPELRVSRDTMPASLVLSFVTRWRQKDRNVGKNGFASFTSNGKCWKNVANEQLFSQIRNHRIEQQKRAAGAESTKIAIELIVFCFATYISA
jgi:hypothetical protein